MYNTNVLFRSLFSTHTLVICIIFFLAHAGTVSCDPSLTLSPSLYSIPRSVVLEGETQFETRSRLSLIWSCLYSILLCTWLAIHPNVDERLSAFGKYTRKIRFFLWALLLPEGLVVLALRQRIHAKVIREIYNRHLDRKRDVQPFVEGSSQPTPLYRDEPGCIYELPTFPGDIHDSPANQHPNNGFDLDPPAKISTWSRIKGHLSVVVSPVTRSWGKLAAFWKRKRLQKWLDKVEKRKEHWSVIHGHFMSMGGFICLIPDTDVRFPVVFGAHFGDDRQYTMDPEDFDLNMFDLNTRGPTERDITDRSKKDIVASILALLHLTWFAIQFFARINDHLTVTPLEVATMAYIAASSLLYLIWWNKPKDVDCAIIIRLSEHGNNSGKYTDIMNYEQEWSLVDWTRDELENDPNRFIPRISPNYDITTNTRISATYSGEITDLHSHWTTLAGVVLASIFGVIHLGLWSAHFPSRPSITESWKWSVSFMIVIPVAIFSILSIRNFFLMRGWIGTRWSWSFIIIRFLCSGSYFMARMSMVVSLLIYIAYAQELIPANSLDVVPWTSILPHLAVG